MPVEPSRVRARRAQPSNSQPRRRVGGGKPTRAARNDDLTKIMRGEFTSQQVEDPFSKTMNLQGTSSHMTVIHPPFNFNALLRMLVENSILRQCIDAMVVNVEGHGHRLEYVGPEGEENSEAADIERQYIEEFLETPNESYTFMELRKRVRHDLETVGNAFIEVGRRATGEVISLWHVPAHLVRLTSVDNDATRVNVERMRFGKRERFPLDKHFRRFVQHIGAKRVYFKELGDPRSIDPETGLEDTSLAVEDTATEIIHLKHYHPGSAYGVPRWINNVVAIQGAHQAELTNLDYFRDNAIPAMAVLVSGGTVTQQSLEDVEEHLTAARGREAQNRILLLEAHGDEDAQAEDGSIPPPKIEIKPLSGERPKDGLFLEYDERQTSKVRSSFRLPPIFTGHAQDYSHASAKTSYEVAEGQVFGPERAAIDDMINMHILSTYNVQYWAVRSNPPRITDPEDVLRAIEAFESVGAMTPNIAIGLANEMFDLEIPKVEDDWGDYPFTVVQALASSGKIKGFEDIVAEAEAGAGNIDGLVSGNTDPGATGGDGGQPGGDNPFANADGEVDDTQRAEVGRVVRGALLQLRDALSVQHSTRVRQRRADPNVLQS